MALPHRSLQRASEVDWQFTLKNPFILCVDDCTGEGTGSGCELRCNREVAPVGAYCPRGSSAITPASSSYDRFRASQEWVTVTVITSSMP